MRRMIVAYARPYSFEKLRRGGCIASVDIKLVVGWCWDPTVDSLRSFRLHEVCEVEEKS